MWTVQTLSFGFGQKASIPGFGQAEITIRNDVEEDRVLADHAPSEGG